MNTLKSSVRSAVDVLRNGGIVAMPTEGVYGLGCSPAFLSTIKRLCHIKQRDEQKGFILVAADLAQLTPYIQPLTDEQLKMVQATWPGPVTWVVPVKPDVSPLIHGEKPTIAVRVTAHPILAEICRELNCPIISTSANKSQEPPIRSAHDIDKIFSINQIDYILEGPLGDLTGPTEIRDLNSGTIVRPY